jgi:Thioredoxin
MRVIWLLSLVAVLPQLPTDGPADAGSFLRRGKTWEQFLSGVSAQREIWLKTESMVTVSPEFVERVKSAGRGLRLTAIAEDWCPDSAYALPYVARLAVSAGVPLHIVDRAAGEPLLAAHRTPDGRTATPTIVLWRNGRDAGAWVERPAELQRMFLSMSTNPESAQRFSQRHAWYESDRGLSVLREIVALIERSRGKE